ncbi:MAG: penicillin-binding protein [Oscillospiraceae bacterium]|nr:penicillin-binding protein [Oscillospiraceae bacterium]
MNKITNRAVSVLLIAALIIVGLTVYVLRYIDHGKSWAMSFSRANAGVTGTVTDRDGLVLAAFDETRNAYAENALDREACYHVTGDYWGRSGTGILSAYWDDMQSFSLLTGTTHAESAELKLTVDTGLCRTAYAALLGQNGMGAAMLMNYRTGEVLCMVSAPSVDPLDSETEPPEGAYINRCLSSVFTPGSVFKLVTAAAAIETVPNMDSRQFYCENLYTIAGVDIKCTGPHYTQTFEQALANSCNIAFAQIAVKVGQTNMIEHVRAYGFLDRHELSGLRSAAGNYPLDFVGDPELAWSGIGQSTDLVNPYAMLRFVAAIANHGVLVEPHLLMSETPAAGETRLMQADTADRLAAMMNYNVVSHYEPEDNFPGLPLCAKTGTAELGDGTSHAWFVGFLNDEAHPYAFVVLVERGGSGLRVAGPVANRLLQEAMKR